MPKNETGDIILEIMKEDGIEPAMMDSKSIKFQAEGYYRTIIEKPKDMKYEIVNFDDADQDIMEPDYHEKPHPLTNGSKFKGVRLLFNLKPSTYATMLFREITKRGTDFKSSTRTSIKIKEERDKRREDEEDKEEEEEEQ